MCETSFLVLQEWCPWQSDHLIRRTSVQLYPRSRWSLRSASPSPSWQTASSRRCWRPRLEERAFHFLQHLAFWENYLYLPHTRTFWRGKTSQFCIPSFLFLGGVVCGRSQVVAASDRHRRLVETEVAGGVQSPDCGDDLLPRLQCLHHRYASWYQGESDRTIFPEMKLKFKYCLTNGAIFEAIHSFLDGQV